MDKIIADINLRESLIERVEVLNKVKTLFLIPKLNFMTTQDVADYYEVPLTTMRNVISRNKEELESDGVVLLSRNDVISRSIQNEISVECFKTHACLTADDGIKHIVSNRGTLIFPKRAVLRVGMLLHKSEIAKEVRTQLLNIEEKTSIDIKTEDIDIEIEMLSNILASSFMNNDIELFANTSMKLKAFQDRHKEEAISELKERNKLLVTERDKLLIEKESLMNELDAVKKINIALTGEMTLVTDTQVFGEVLNSMLIRLSNKRGFRSTQLCFKEFYILLRNRHEIYLTGRAYGTADRDPNKPIYAYLTQDEWPTALEVATALCHKFDVEITDLLNRLEGKL